MIATSRSLNVRHIATSVEVWQDDTLAGGLYGVAIGAIFFGESIFTRIDNAFKVALVHLCRFLHSRGFAPIDCQILTGQLPSPGAEQIPRAQFAHLPGQYRDQPTLQASRDAGSIAIPEGPRAADVAAEVGHAR